MIEWGEQAEAHIRRQLDDAGIVFGMREKEIQRRLGPDMPLIVTLKDFPLEFGELIHPVGKLFGRLKAALHARCPTLKEMLRRNEEPLRGFARILDTYVTPECYERRSDMSGNPLEPGQALRAHICDFAADGGASRLQILAPDKYAGPLAWDFGVPFHDDHEPAYWREIQETEFSLPLAICIGTARDADLSESCDRIKKFARQRLDACFDMVLRAGWDFTRAIATLARIWWEDQMADPYAKKIMPEEWRRIRERGNQIWNERVMSCETNAGLRLDSEEYGVKIWRPKVEVESGSVGSPSSRVEVKALECHLEAVREAPADMAKRHRAERLEGILREFQFQFRRKLEAPETETLSCASGCRRSQEKAALAAICESVLDNAGALPSAEKPSPQSREEILVATAPLKGWFSVSELCEQFSIPTEKREAFAKAIRRWRTNPKNLLNGGHTEDSNAVWGSARFRYSIESIADLVRSYGGQVP